MSRPAKLEYYMQTAKAVCKRSTCLRRRYGAVIVKDDQIISTGYNGNPRGTSNCCDTGECNRTGMKHNDADYSMCNAVHAEMNAMLSASRLDMIGAEMYLYGEDADGNEIEAIPCNICRNLLINSGIKICYNRNTLIKF